MKISVIIPCYNDGIFLTEAVDSVLACDYKDLELIIVNDGSTDKLTLEVLAKYEEQGFKIISHPNQGLGFSRNRGIQQAQGEYILPLDADNKIRKGYLDKGMELLDSGVCDIVYAKPYFFGEDIPERKFVTHEFDGDQLFIQNFIDACAIFRKTAWKVVGGYDENMPSQGHEDWELWLHFYIKEFRFRFLDEELFEYRINGKSMNAKLSEKKLFDIRNYIMIKYVSQYREQLLKIDTYRLFYLNDQRYYLRTSIKYCYKFTKSLFVALFGHRGAWKKY